MSVEENNIENEVPVEVDTIETAPVVEQVVEADPDPVVEPIVEPAPVETPQVAECCSGDNASQSFLALRDTNPTVFYGVVAAGVLVLLILFS